MSLPRLKSVKFSEQPTACSSVSAYYVVILNAKREVDYPDKCSL